MTTEEIIADLEDLLRGIPLTLPKDDWHKDEFTVTVDALKICSRSLVNATEGIEPQFKQYKLGDKAALLILLRNIKEGAGSLQKVINKLEPHLEADMCMAIAEQGLNTFQTATHTLTGKADAYLSRYPKDDRDTDWAEMIADPGIAALQRNVLPPKDLEKVCRTRLENGEDLPHGCEVYIKASVGIRKRPT